MGISELIPFGHDNAVSRGYLTSVTRMSDRDVRESIAEDVLAGEMIINIGQGYFRYSGKADYPYLTAAFMTENARAKSVQRRADALRRALEIAQKD